MGKYNYLHEWEGDSSSVFETAVWKSKKVITNRRGTITCGRVVFTGDDFSTYQSEVDTRNDTLKRNRDKISSGKVDDCGGAPGGGFCFATVCIAGDVLEEVPSVPTYSGSDSIVIKLYGDGELQTTATVWNEKPFTFGAGYRAREWEVQPETTVSIERIELASSMRELMEQ